MRRLALLGALAGLCGVLLAADADAWEFRMKGEFEYRLRYWGRTGPLDLFGDARAQDTTPITSFIGFAGPNYYQSGTTRPIASSNALSANVQIERGGFSVYGSDAHITDMKLTLYPLIRINAAMTLYATLNFGGFRHKYSQSRSDGTLFQIENNVVYRGGSFLTVEDSRIGYPHLMPGVPPFERYYMSQTSDSAFNTASIISVEQFKAVLQLPFGIVAVGTKDFPIGVGATYARNTREESIYLVVPYGPLSFHTYIFPNQQASGRGGFTNVNSWLMHPDADIQSAYFLGQMIQYTAGPLEIGVVAFVEGTHTPPGMLQQRHALDQYWRQWLFFVKYFNGKFFLNAEYAFDTTDHRRAAEGPPRLDMPDGYGTRAGVTYVERYLAFLETGLVFGPTKVSLLWAQSSGPVANNPPSRPVGSAVPHTSRKIYRSLLVNYQAMEPYNYLIFYTYAGGNSLYYPNDFKHGTFSADAIGEMGDAVAFAGRVDYAVASNLNVWASYLWAHRLEQNGALAGSFGYGFNWYESEAQAWKAVNLGISDPSGLNPYVDDGFLGWEMGIGLDWKLLEGLTMRGRYARWAPGPWFDQAFKAYTSTPQGLNGNGLLIGRDPIHAVEFSFLMQF